MVVIAVTGHRPDKLGGYKPCEWHRAIRRNMRDFLLEAPDGPMTLLSGCALGVDQWWMEVGFDLEIPVVGVVPFEGFDSNWPVASQVKLKTLLAKCEEVIYVSEPGYSLEKLDLRNRYLVDNCDTLVAYWNGSASGTQNCVDYAGSLGRRTIIINPEELRYDNKN